VTAFANQTGELLFSGYAVIDNITFSSQAVPEPSAAGIMMFGAAILGIRLFRGRVARGTQEMGAAKKGES